MGKAQDEKCGSTERKRRGRRRRDNRGTKRSGTTVKQPQSKRARGSFIQICRQPWRSSVTSTTLPPRSARRRDISNGWLSVDPRSLGGMGSIGPGRGLSKPSGCARAVVSTHRCKKPFGPHCPVRSTRLSVVTKQCVHRLPSVLLQLTCKRALTLSGLGNISVPKPLHLVGVS